VNQVTHAVTTTASDALYLLHTKGTIPMTSTIEKLNELQEAQGSDGILEMMADRDGSAFLLDKFFTSISESECDEWLVWLKSKTQRNHG
jgi:hypothetical protein